MARHVRIQAAIRTRCAHRFVSATLDHDLVISCIQGRVQRSQGSSAKNSGWPCADDDLLGACVEPS